MNKQKAFLYFGVVPALFLNLIGSLFYFVLFADSGFANVLYGVTKVMLLVLPVSWLLVYRALPKVSEAVNTKLSLVYGVISGLLITIVGFAIFFAFEEFFRGFTPMIYQKVVQMNLLHAYIPFAIGLSLAHSLFEEFYWRFFVFRGLLLKFSPLVAALISSAAFASHHFVVLSQFFSPVLTIMLGLAVFVGGLLWCAMYVRTGSIWGSWVSHIFVDAAIFAVGYLLVFG
jgi:membrane protease YdiL (CAAX protease family)